ncbi:hypothetical protein [Cognataquiflexum rubidum]|uniref:hypothetical protein n=1 Tax=Cognataquiflexum rubidum TaxID=2922273 RepID=UPI001F12EE08|nr:hypothetical protein [Cognataquiflexum rubidum]MCH6234027.1 hypothetical protein [Cognataquiflexum rubidum]
MGNFGESGKEEWGEEVGKWEVGKWGWKWEGGKSGGNGSGEVGKVGSLDDR